jgi:hypothetical protein
MTSGNDAQPTSPQERIRKEFTLKELLHEMTTANMRPTGTCECGCADYLDCICDRPEMFYSALMDALVGGEGVLALVRALPCGVLEAPLRRERACAAGPVVVLLGGGRRFALHGDCAHELCGALSCTLRPLEYFGWCEEHLCEQNPARLITAAGRWGESNLRGTEVMPQDACDSRSVVPLVRAAVIQGCFDEVQARIMESAFFNPDDLCDAFDEDVLAYRYVYDRERLLLREAALKAWHSLRGQAKACDGCGRSLGSVPWTVRPAYCSEACDLADRPAPEPDVWDEPPF